MTQPSLWFRSSAGYGWQEIKDRTLLGSNKEFNNIGGHLTIRHDGYRPLGQGLCQPDQKDDKNDLLTNW
jgi:hypothetical protein